MADWTPVRHIWRPDQCFGRFPFAFVEASRHVLRRLAHLFDMTDILAVGLEEVLTTSELAAYLKVTRQVIYDLRHDGQGPRGIHVKELRCKVSETAAWIRQRSDPMPH